ncbi:MAG: diguanylate cyclase [Mariprofundus sp.]|nr:diguanylate cyclase [Mariprofundus sp.]
MKTVRASGLIESNLGVSMLDESGLIKAEVERLVPKPLCILLVDDHKFFGDLMGLLLKGEDDLQLHYCATAEQAKKLLETMKPAVILQDLTMPDVDGIDMVRYYKQSAKTAHVPVIVLSAHEKGQVKGDAFDAGANDYMVKVPDKTELLARLRYHATAYMNYLESQLLMRELKRISTLDGLTGIANRRCFNETLSYEWKRSQREKLPVSLLMVDVDYFKNFNDEYGHPSGDECLQRVAKALEVSALRAADLTARYGGEEFALILANTDEIGAMRVAQAVRNSILKLAIPHALSATASVVTVSVGVATVVPEYQADYMQLLKAADQGLYQAKQNGRNQVAKNLILAEDI